MRLLYHHPIYSKSRAVRLLLGEYAIEHKALIESTWNPSAELKNFNCYGVLPILVESETSAIIGLPAISEYVEETFANDISSDISSEIKLYPQQIEQRAEMRRLLDLLFTNFDSQIVAPIAYERVIKRIITIQQGGGAPNSDILRVCRLQLQNYLAYFGSLIEMREYLACDKLTFADLAFAACLCGLDYLGEIEWLEGSVLKNYYSRIKSRPAFRPLLSDRIQGVACVSHFVDLDF